MGENNTKGVMPMFDAHFHIIDPSCPLWPNQGYMPPPFTVEDYRRRVSELNVVGGAIVSGSFQGMDYTYLEKALGVLGKRFFGVVPLASDTSAATLRHLHRLNVRGMRCNAHRGGRQALRSLTYLADKVYERWGWHTELYLDSRKLEQYTSLLGGLKKFSIDHVGLSKEGLQSLYRWVEKGMRVKATGWGRLDFAPLPALKKIYEINPDALMFGADLPSTRAPAPFSVEHVRQIKTHFSPAAQQKILYQNAVKWYGGARANADKG